MATFEATDEYLVSMREVHVLLSAADSSEPELAMALCKAGLVLLSGKFESFAESIAEEYVFEARDACARFTEIPLALRVHHSIKLLADVQSLRQFSKHNQAQTIFTQLSELWNGGQAPSTINVDCKFSYGKHGEEELRRLFNNVGIADVFSDVVVTVPDESLLAEQNESERIDFRGVFNSLTNIRNNILHQDASPNLTAPQVRDFATNTTKFAIALDQKLSSLLPTRVPATTAST